MRWKMERGFVNCKGLCRCCLLTCPPVSQAFLSACLFAGSIWAPGIYNKDKRLCPCRIRFGRRQTHQLLIALSAIINVCARSRLRKRNRDYRGLGKVEGKGSGQALQRQAPGQGFEG